ncbi:MAG: superfamily II DNA/RNA helicase, partial [Planctomycetota bacterium]
MDEIQQAILEMGITKPTPIQALAIEPVLKGKDVIAKAETGTGKTLAFGAPMMSKIEAGRSTVLGLVMSPTRELAEQVHKVLQTLGEARGLKTALIVGGEPLGPQVKALQAGAQVVVGTPGRVLDLLNQKFLQFPWTEFAILDEADKMLEIGFIDDIKKILDACNEYRQTLLFSATFPPALLDLARGYTNDPVEIATASGVATVDTINQYVLRCGQEDFPRGLAQLIESSAEKDVFLVFCERRTDVDQLMRTLERKRFSVKALHGGYDQAARFRVMTAFRTGDVKCLVATDVASRGLDVAHVTHVINLGLPREFSDYTHRIGRTGRAGRHGAAVTFISGKNERDFEGLLKHTGFDIEELERPRDLFIKERKRQLEREAKSDVEVIDVEGGEVEREERSPRKPREERAERTERKPREDRAERTERKPREERPERTERKPREDRAERAERAPREERPERTERKPREDRAERAERKPREDRAERAERAPREERPERTERKPREDRAERAERKPREERPERAERKPRRERAERTETSERPERTEQAEKPERKERPERPRRRERSE